MRADRVPFRKSLLVRLLATSLLVAFCAIVATAWLVVRTTTTAIRQEQGQVLADDAKVYDTLVGYAATHPDWRGVDRTVHNLAGGADLRITLTTQDSRRQPLADSAPSADPLPAKASAVIDPLRVSDAPLSRNTGDEQIDPRAVGPYRLTRVESTRLRAGLDATVRCLGARGIKSSVIPTPGGHAHVDFPVRMLGPWGKMRPVCMLNSTFGIPTPTERSALAQLNGLIAHCLKDHGLASTELEADFSQDGTPAPLPSGAGPVLHTCFDTARREQLTPYTAPAALLFVSGPTGSSVLGFDLSRHSTARIVGVTAIVLALTVTVSVAVSTRLTGPLRALTDAARHHGDDGVRVPVRGDDEISRLAAAFNDLSEHRERTEEQRKIMVSDIAHELRNPLSTIRSWLEGAEDGILVPDRAFTSALLEEAILLQHIVDDLQDLAAADSGTLRLHPEPLHMADVLDQVAAAHLGRATTAGVELWTSSEDGPPVAADPVRLRQAVSNLVSNAVRHTPPGGRVTLRSHRRGNQVAIEVVDTGTGIGPDELPLVFDRFWRAEKSRSRETGGSGLGLAIVRQLTEAHGGTVAATSVPGKETVFTLLLPT